MQGKATIAGHPIHPVLITIPVGCFIAAVVCDIISIWAGQVFWAAMSTWLILFGFFGALLAAFFGFVDYLTAPMTAAAKSLAGWHMALNICVIVIFGIACAVRFRITPRLPATHSPCWESCCYPSPAILAARSRIAILSVLPNKTCARNAKRRKVTSRRARPSRPSANSA